MLNRKIEIWPSHCNYKRRKRNDIEQRRHEDEERACFQSNLSSNKPFNQEMQHVATMEVEEEEADNLQEEPHEVEASPEEPLDLFQDATAPSAHPPQTQPTHSPEYPPKECDLSYQLNHRDHLCHDQRMKQQTMRRLPTSSQRTTERISRRSDIRVTRTAALRYRGRLLLRA
jgi:hypothetical protein